MADAEFDVFDGAFQDEFAELTEPGSRTNDFAVFAAQREKYGFGVRALMADRINLKQVVYDAVPTGFAVYYHRFHVFCTESLAKQPPVVAFVGGRNIQFVEIALDYLPADPRIVRLFHRSMYIEDRISFTITEKHRFHRLERVLRPFCVVLVGSYPIHAGCVNNRNIAKIV